MHWLQCYTLFWRVFANIKSLIFIVWVNIITLCRLFWYYFCFKVINQFQKQPSRLVLKKGVLKIHRKFTVEHPCRSAISIKLQCNFNEIALRHGCSPANLLHIFRTRFLKNTSGWLLPQFHVNGLFLYPWLCIDLTHSFPMHPSSTPWKRQKTLRFSDVFRE